MPPRFSLFLAASLLAPVASAQYLLAVESTNKKVLLLDATNGSVINPAYIDLAAVGASTPIEALQVGSEIWVTDQLADSIFRFSLDGTTHLGTITGGLDNMRGGAFDGTTFYVANSGTANGAPGPAVVMFSPAGANLGSFPVGDPFDVITFQGDLLIANIAADDLDRYTTAGTLVGTFHASDGVTGVDFPEQLALRANGNVLCAGFTAPAGVYEYDSTGVQLNYWTISTGGRGVAELGNGQVLFTDGTGIKSYDAGTAVTTTILGGVSGRFVAPFAGAAPTSVAFCAGDGLDPNVTTPCPCGNAGLAGNGCGNSVNPAGANLAATGVPAFDTVVLNGTGMPATVACIYLQGDGLDDVVFGDGVRCTSGTLLRLRTKVNSGGASSFPDSVETVTLSQRGGVTIGSGAIRYYQTYYRNSAALFCPPETFNVTNGWKIVW